MLHEYTEDQLVEQPAIGLFAELGWHGLIYWSDGPGGRAEFLFEWLAAERFKWRIDNNFLFKSKTSP